jgi:alkylhydroperoxidase family enzyme
VARILPAPREQYAEIFGDEANSRLQIYAQRPPIAVAYRKWTYALHTERVLPDRLLELVRLRIAFHNQCRTCMAIRYEQDGSDEVPEALVCELAAPEDSEALTDAERAALHYADLLATDHMSVSEETFARLRRHFSEAEIVELCFNAAHFVGFGRMMATWHAVDELPERFRVPEAERVTPWGPGETIHKPVDAPARVGA